MDVFRMYAGICGVPSLPVPLTCMVSKRPAAVVTPPPVPPVTLSPVAPPPPPPVNPCSGATDIDDEVVDVPSVNWTT